MRVGGTLSEPSGLGGRTVRRGSWCLSLAFAALLVLAAPASATFHLVKVREVYPAGSASYVELQMLATGEYQVSSHHLVSYNADGTVADDFTLPNNVNANSRTNATILITGPGYAAAFPSGPSGDEADANLDLSPAGGAVCWIEGEPPDCVAWGDFTGPLPAHMPALTVGSPVSPGGVTAEKALLRTIAPNCATRLEAADDSDDSATDFSEQTPNPRNNASPVTETDCVTPEALIDSKPANPTNSTSAVFAYHSTPEGAEFECQLDGGGFAACPLDEIDIPGPLGDGAHNFQVRAVNTQGTGLPAVYTWTVDTQPPTATITGHPADPSAGTSAAFTYTASQLGSTFECSLAAEGSLGAFSPCPGSGVSYAGLADGVFTFEVRATDKAGNEGAPVAYTWHVDNSLGTVTPPVVPSTPVVPPVIPKPPTALHCKKGFVKKKVKGKVRCVKKKKRRHKRH